MSEYKLRFEHISMAFPGVLALDDVSFGIRPGTVHVLMGENGAGKSTLMKILNGSYLATEGQIYIDDKPVRFTSAMDAELHGVSMIYQELSYIPDFTIERYLMLCREPKRFGFIDWKAVSREAQQILETHGMDYDPKTTMRELSVSDIQLLEITRAITAGSIQVLIMDEPTSALSNAEIDRLFDNIRRLKAMGITIIYISHRMDEIFRIADEITVMRDGKHIRTAPASDYTPDSLVQLMVGRELSNVYPKEDVPIGDTVLEVEHLVNLATKVNDVSFHVKAGEIVGLGGLMGAGRTEIVRSIFGLDPFDSGTIKIDGKPVKIKTVSDAVKNGIAMATEDRRRYGLIFCRSLLENITLASLGQVSKGGFLQKRKERELAKEPFLQLHVKASGLHTLAGTLSGGNQQKIVLSKWLMARPRVLILDEPTRGIDVGAKYEIYKIMTNLARSGMAIIMISSELPEFIGMCDRCYTVYGGRITGELMRDEMTQERIVMLATGGKVS